MKQYDYECLECGETHSYFTGRITQGRPEIFNNRDKHKIESPHDSIFIFDNEIVYVNGIVLLHLPNTEEPIEIDNWFTVDYVKWNQAIKNKIPIKASIYFSVPLFKIDKNEIFNLGYNDETNEFLFFADNDKSDLYRWQTEGMNLSTIENLFSSFLHSNLTENYEDVITYTLREAVGFIKENLGNSYVHALLNGEVIFQLIDSFGLENPGSYSDGIGMDIPIDLTYSQSNEIQISSFVNLSKFSIHIIDDIQIYQYDYEKNINELENDIRLIAKDVYGVKPEEISYRLEIMKKLN